MEAKVIQKYKKKSYSQLHKIAKTWFHKFIRLRDTDDLGYEGNNTFVTEMNLGDHDFKEGTIIGYNFKISYEDGSSEKYPNKESQQEFENIYEFYEEEYYFTITLQEDTIDSGSGDDAGIILYFGL